MIKCIVGQASSACVVHGGSSSTPSLLPFPYAGTAVFAIRVHVIRLYHPSDDYYHVIYVIRACIFLYMYCDDMLSNY